MAPQLRSFGVTRYSSRRRSLRAKRLNRPQPTQRRQALKVSPSLMVRQRATSLANPVRPVARAEPEVAPKTDPRVAASAAAVAEAVAWVEKSQRKLINLFCFVSSAPRAKLCGKR